MSMREAQERLNGLGYNVGTPATRRRPEDGQGAGANFSRPRGLPVTGKAGHGHGRRALSR